MDEYKFFLINDLHFIYAPSKLHALLFYAEEDQDNLQIIHIVEVDPFTVIGFACWNGEHNEIYLRSVVNGKNITQFLEVDDY